MLRTMMILGSAVAAGYYLSRAYETQRCHKAVKKVLPDVAGNYDLDGVSYDKDEHSVVVSGDKHHVAAAPNSAPLLN